MKNTPIPGGQSNRPGLPARSRGGFSKVLVLPLLVALSFPGKSYGVTSINNPQHFRTQVAQQLHRLAPHQKLINQQFQRHRPTVLHILDQLEKYQLPKNFVLIPMIESTFNPKAVSPAKAAGLWQLMPATAKRFGLTVSKQQDERLNIKRSTEAAIAYLSFLYQKFDRDVMLTLAAYNAGEGRVQRAIKQQKSKQFPALDLPGETINYVHKFYALLDLVDNANLSRSTALHQDPATLQQTEWKKLPPLDSRQKILLAELFETRPVIDMKPVKPLISL